MHRKRILLAALLAALIVSVLTITLQNGLKAESVSPTTPLAAPTGFTITSPTTGSLVPCGQPITVTWTGGSPTDNVNLTLIDVQAFQVYQGFGVEPNTGSRVVTIEPGSCGRTSQFYVEDSPRTTWTYGPVFNVECANTFNIADGDVAGLIAAINSANASSCPTTINLAHNGTYTLTDVADDGSGFYCCGPSGLPYVQSPLTINGSGATIQRSNAAGTPPFGIIRVAHYPGPVPSTTSNLTLDGVILTGATGPVVGVWQSTALVRNTTITNNPGQGILTFGSNLTVLNSTISYNTGTSCVGPICGYGGGGILHFASPSTVISYSTIFENQSGGVGDAIATAFSDPGSVTVKNSILASPTRGLGLVCWVNGPGAVLSLGHNIGGDSTCGPGGNSAPSGFIGPGDMNNTNPLLGPLANNGGPTPTHMPLCNSPAIDAVPLADSTDVNSVPITTDQRGISRPQGAGSDIGAVELSHSQTVTIPSTAGPWSTSLNPNFDYGVHNNAAPVVIDAGNGVAFTPGNTITVTYLNGTVQAGAGHPPNDANGEPGNVTNHYTGGNSNLPALYMNPGPDVLSMELVGTFANNGVIVGQPFPIGNGPTALTVPTGANQLLLGINDNYYGDNSGSFNVVVTSASSTTMSVTAPNDSSASADVNCQAAIPDYIAGTIVSGGSGSVTLSQNPAAGTLVGLGPHTVTVTATDGCGNNSDTVVFTVVDNTPPNFTTASSDITVNTDAGQCSARVAFALSTAADNCSNVTVSSSPGSGSTFPTGTSNVTVTARDAAGNTTSRSFTVTVVDHENPTFSCPANVNIVDNRTGSCGAAFTPSAPVASDNCAVASVVGTRSDGHALTDLYPVGNTTINWVVTDTSGNTASCPQTVTVSNPAPSVSITSPASGALYVVNSAITFNATFADNAGDSHTAVWTLDGLPQAGIVNETAHTITASHTFTAAGVYAVTLTVVDDCGQTATTNQVGGFDAFVVIYDPNAGFVTGGGWIDSPLGAYTPNPLLVGRANFGFVSKYQPGANVPDGQTEFQFKAGNLNFHSTSYDWLVVAGARAQYKGSGTINGAGNYAFMLTAIDGQINGGGGVDKFRIKIWDKNSGGLIYDNQLNAPDSADPSTALGGGSIVIHK
jgi:HYR domain/Right handed beta helix region/PKD domain